MASEEKHPRYVNEQGEHEERKMSVNTLLNNTSTELIHIKHPLHSSTNDIARVSEFMGKDERPSSYDDQYIEYIEGSPPTTPTVTATALPQRAPCSVCKSETGRCHASDPSTMQSFFASTLGFEGVLNVADWLCMKCYSKWYNRCKRKATSSLAMNVVVDSSMPLPTQQKRKRREKDKDHAHNLPKVEGEKKDSDRDTDSDDALLLARIGGNFPLAGYAQQPNPEESTDLETSSMEELRSEVIRLRKDMRKMVGDIAQRDEQIEGMMSFVRNEVSSMHNLLKDLHGSKWGPSPASSTPSSPVLQSTCNNLPSLASLPIPFSVPSMHS